MSLRFGVDFAPPMGYIRFVSNGDESNAFSCRLGNDVPRVTDGYAGWAITQRPRQRGLTEWKGNNPLTMTIPVLFDALLDDARGIANSAYNLEQDIRKLEKMAGLDADTNEPPQVKFHANGAVPNDEHDASQLTWVIYGIDWGDAVRNAYGNRVRAEATITVCQFVTDNQLSQSLAQKMKKPSGSGTTKPKHKVHRVTKGETLSSIAAVEYGNGDKWRDIASANPINGRARRDPKSVKVGELLKLP